MSQHFSVADLPSLRATRGPVVVDIGHLGNEDHLDAFVEIFTKFIKDNEDFLAAFDGASVSAKKPVAEITIHQLREEPRVVARLLYSSLNQEVRILLQGRVHKNELVIYFDNPSFEFASAL